MKINGRLIYLAMVIIVVLSLLLYIQALGSEEFCLMMGTILGYFFGNERAFIKAVKKEQLEGRV